MIETLRVTAIITAMERDIVASRAQIRVVRVGLPDQLHAEHANVKVLGPLDIETLSAR